MSLPIAFDNTVTKIKSSLLEEAEKEIIRKLRTQFKTMNQTNVKQFNEKGKEFLEADQKVFGKGRPPSTMQHARVLYEGLGNVVFGVQQEPARLQVTKCSKNFSEIEYQPYVHDVLRMRELQAGTRMVGASHEYPLTERSKKKSKHKKDVITIFERTGSQWFYVDMADWGVTRGDMALCYKPIKGNYVAFMSTSGKFRPLPIRGLGRLSKTGRYFMGRYIERALSQLTADLSKKRLK